MSTALVLIQVLGGIGLAGALASIPLVVRGARRRQLVAAERGPRRPALGSPAQVWLARGERVHRELTALLAEHGAWQEVSADAGQVVAELAATAGRVAELDHARSLVTDPRPRPPAGSPMPGRGCWPGCRPRSPVSSRPGPR